MRVCFHVLFSCSAMVVFVFHQSTIRFVRDSVSSVLASSILFSSTALRVFLLHFCNAGPSRRRVEQASLLYGLCFAISPEPNYQPPPHISEIYLSIGSIEQARRSLRTPPFGCLESSKRGHVVHCWALHMGNCAFAVFLERAGLYSCPVSAALHVTF